MAPEDGEVAGSHRVAAVQGFAVANKQAGIELVIGVLFNQFADGLADSLAVQGLPVGFLIVHEPQGASTNQQVLPTQGLGISRYKESVHVRTIPSKAMGTVRV